MSDDARKDTPGGEPGQMPEGLEELARRYVDLWQDQMSALAADPAFAESLQKVMSAMGVAASGLPAMWAAWPAAMTGVMAAARPAAQDGNQGGGQETHGKPGPQSEGGRQDTATAASGAASAAAAPDGGGTDLGDLAERLAALEQRVRELEGRAGRARGRTKGKAGGG